MNQKEAVDVLKSIQELYPKFHVTKKKAQLLIPQLKRMDYEGVMRNLTIYVADHPFAPTIAEIAAYPAEVNEHLENMKKWQEEADKVPEEVKLKFRKQFAILMKEIAGNEERQL